MAIIDAPTQLLCQQCAAALVVEPGSQYATCDYCGTVNFLDKSEAVLHYAVRPTIDEPQADATLRRWMAGNHTAKGLDKDARIQSRTFEYFPMWLARTEAGGEEIVHLRPGAALSVMELDKLQLPAASLAPYDDSMDGLAVRPTVPVTTIRSWLTDNKGVAAGGIREIALVHVPLYQFKYAYKGQTYTALVDAAAGQVFAAIFPAKFELPYVSIGGFGCLAYFLAALIPAITWLVMPGTAGVGLGMAIYLVVAVALAIPIFLVAASISRKF